MQEGHTIDGCKRNIKCFDCCEQNKHHRSLCLNTFKTKSTFVYTTNNYAVKKEQCAQQKESSMFKSTISETEQDITIKTKHKGALLAADKTVSKDTLQTHNVHRSPTEKCVETRNMHAEGIAHQQKKII